MILQAASKLRPGSDGAGRRLAMVAMINMLIVFLSLAVSAPLRAQEEQAKPEEQEEQAEEQVKEEADVEEGPEEAGVEEGRPFHRLSLGIEAWVAQPAGLEYTPATIREPGTNFFSSIDTPFSTETEGRYTAAFHLPESLGAVTAAYYNHSTTTEMGSFRPGEYVFGELLAAQGSAGVLDDGFADGFTATTTTGLRDWQVAYGRPAFRTPKVLGDWSIGWRRVDHRRFHQANYFATVPPPCDPLDPEQPCFPPTPSPAPSLIPLRDLGEVRSEFDGRGLTGALDLGFNLWRDRLIFESTVSLAVMRGDVEARSSSVTHQYRCTTQIFHYPATVSQPDLPPELLCESGQILGSNLSILARTVDSDPAPASVKPFEVANGVDQTDRSEALGSSTSATSMVTDLVAGFRWRALEWLDARIGFRQSRYTDVGLDLKPSGSFPGQFTEVARDATYEGFFFGVVFQVF